MIIGQRTGVKAISISYLEELLLVASGKLQGIIWQHKWLISLVRPLAIMQPRSASVEHLKKADQARPVRGVGQANRAGTAFGATQLATCHQVKLLQATSASLHTQPKISAWVTSCEGLSLTQSDQ